jgi:hypothetical protein
MHSRHALTAALALPLAALAFAGCGGGSPKSSVASLGSSTTTTTQNDAAPSGAGTANGASSGSGRGLGLTMKTQNGTKFAACMRSHGVPNFPDPSSGGNITVGPGSGIDPSSPKFRAAESTCQKLLPNGGQPSPQEQAKAQQKMLDFSKCMRAHGVHDFPDPTFSGGRGSLMLKGGRGSDLDPKSPTFQAAQKACAADLPGKPVSESAGGK